MNIAMGADQNTPIYFIDNSLEEVQVRTSGNDAEVSTPGVAMIAIMKSGGNTFHGSYRASWQPGGLAGKQPERSPEGTEHQRAAKLKKFYDAAGDLGGRIIRDKLWFYGGYARQTKNEGLAGFAADAGPDGQHLTGDEPQAYFESSLYQYSLKLSYQMSKNNRVVYAWQRGVKTQPQNGGGRLRPLEATRDYRNPTAIQKAEWQSTVTPRLLLNAMGGYAGYITDYDATRSYATADRPSRQEFRSGLFYGSHVQRQGKTRDRYQGEASAAFFPQRSFAGQHDFKTGVTIYWDRTSDDWLNNAAGNYVLIDDQWRAVPHPRLQHACGAERQRRYLRVVFQRYLACHRQIDIQPWCALGVSTLVSPRPGLRGRSRFSDIFPSKRVDKLDVQTFTRAVPRVGVAYDLGGKSVIKATWGLYNYILGDTYGDVFAPTATANAVFLWHDLNGDKLWQPGESDLSLGAGNPDFVSVTAASNYELSPELKQPDTWETTASYERELAPSLGFRVMYINKVVSGSLETINAKRPYSAYNMPLTRRDPGPDAVLGNGDDAGRVTIYDYSAAYQGGAFVSNKRVNADNTDRFHTVELTLTKRASNRWMGQVSYFAVKNHRWLVGTYQNPNDELFPLDETWSWAGTVSGSYRTFYDISVSGFLQSKSGVKGQRTHIFSRNDPDGGAPIAQANTLEVRLEPYGSQQLEAFNILNFRVNKDFRLTGGRRLSIDIDAFNLLNLATPTGAEFRSGGTFGYVTGVTPPRIFRLGARFTF